MTGAAPPEALAPLLRRQLEALAKQGATQTYADAAQALGLEPPQTIHRVAIALEKLIEEDAAAERPLLAALVVSRTREGLPAPGFFAKAAEVGRYAGPERGRQAQAFHRAELERVWSHWSGQPSGT